METRNRLPVIGVGLVICCLLVVGIDFWLARFGQAIVFKPKLPEGITMKYNDLQGYSFIEDGFIHIIDEHTIYDQDTIDAISAYYANGKDVFVKSKTVAGTILLLQIHTLESTDGQLRYDLKQYKNDGIEDWIDIPDQKNVRLSISIRNIFTGAILVLLVVNLFRWINVRRLRDKHNR